MLFRATRVLRIQPAESGRYPTGRPTISRTRSWRGLMQVRFDDTRADRNQFLKHLFVWAPMRVFGSAISVSMILYFYLGHDQYMHAMMGYESEAYLENKKANEPQHRAGDLIFNTRAAMKNVRDLEPDNHKMPVFSVFRDDVGQTPLFKYGNPEEQKVVGHKEEEQDAGAAATPAPAK